MFNIDEYGEFALEALRYALQGGAVDLEGTYRNLNDQDLWRFAKCNRIAPILAHALMDSIGTADIPSYWRSIHLETYRATCIRLEELDFVAACLHKEGIPIIVLENAGLARSLGLCAGCFQFSDVDLLVKPEHMYIVHKVVTGLGYELRSGGRQARSQAGHPNERAEYLRFLPGGDYIRLNFQCSFVARRWFDPGREPKVDSLIARSIGIPGSYARVLCPEDNLFQLAIHSASHTFVRPPGISLHLDIARFIRHVKVYWADFVGLVRRFRAKTKVFFALAIPKVLFSTPVPGEVMQRLRPSRWKERQIARCLNGVGLLNPDNHKLSKIRLVVLTVLSNDDLRGLWGSLFPDPMWMRDRYGISSQLLVLWHYARRLVQLGLGRM